MHPVQKMRIVLLAFFVLLSVPARAVFEWLPRGKPFPITYADPRDLRFYLGYDFSGKFDAAVSNFLSVFSEKSGDAAGPAFYMGFEGGGFFRLRVQGTTFPLETVDGLIGVFSELGWGMFKSQLRLRHISAHLADGVDTTVAIPYSRDSLQLRMALNAHPTFTFYAGGSLLVNAVPLAPGFAAQAGFQWLPRFGEGVIPGFFLAGDAQWKEEIPGIISVALQAGVYIAPLMSRDRPMRLYYSYYQGLDPRGQFYSERVQTHWLGLELPIF